MSKFEQLLSGGDLRSIGNSNAVVACIGDQRDFDELFECLYHRERIVVMRAADAIEKITRNRPEYLAKHRAQFPALCHAAGNKELKWHLALLIPRLRPEDSELEEYLVLLRKWVVDRQHSRIVRVNSLQGLFELSKQDPGLLKQLHPVLDKLEKEGVPSLNARIRKIREGKK